MRDVHQAIEALGDLIGMDGVAFDANGDLTLIFDGATTVNLHMVDEVRFELWADLPDLGNVGDPRLLTAVLCANHLGEGTGAARLALRPDGSAFVICERVDVTGVDAPALGETVATFARSAAFWTSSAARQTVGGSQPAQAPATDFAMIRV